MKKSVRYLRHGFKKIERFLQQGEEIRITKRQRVIAWLAPDRDERTYQIYIFNSTKDRPTWLTCGYSNTAVIISMPLPPEIKSCKVMHDPKVLGYPATGMTCR